MKKLVIISVIALLTAFWSIAGAQEFPEEYLGLPGDNLNLYAVMKLFQESETLEGFEQSLNDENSRINNLDLNGDNLVDYLMVMDYVDGNVHTIVLRAALGRNETQDVAVFTVQQFSDNTVQIQLVGDEALYGKNYIIEPIYAEESETPNPGYIGTPVRGQKVTVVRTTTYEVASWPLISFIFRPTYVVWRSNWHWGYYPTYYNPWRPFYWHAYYGYHSHWHHHYYAYYRPWHSYRHNHYTNYYYTRVRTYSPTVVVNINNGNYRNTYSRPETRRVGERLYASTNNGRSSLDTNSARVRTSGSTTVQRSSVNSGSSANERSAVRSGAEVQTSTTRRSSTGDSGRTSSGSSVDRSTGVERKSGTIATGSSDRSSSTRNPATVTRRAESSSPARTATSPSVERSTETYGNKSASPVPNRSASTSAVRERSTQRPSATVSGRTASPSVRQSAPQREAPKVSTNRAQRSQPAVKSAPSRSSSRSSGASVGSSRSASKPAASAPARSSSSGSSGRR